jgi:SAM-dependent methyltransferase
MVKKATAKWAGTGAEFVCSQILEYLSEHEEAYYAVYSIFGAAWFTAPGRLFPLVRRRLRPGGVFVFSQPSAIPGAYGPQGTYKGGFAGRAMFTLPLQLPPGRGSERSPGPGSPRPTRGSSTRLTPGTSGRSSAARSLCDELRSRGDARRLHHRGPRRGRHVAVLTAEFPQGGEYVFLPGGRTEDGETPEECAGVNCARKPASPPRPCGPSARTPSP